MFERCNLGQLPLEQVNAHGGRGDILFHRVAGREHLSGSLNFIDVAVLPPGVGIGRHTHAADEEEFYLVLEGHGWMERNGQSFEVGPGDFIRTPPGGSHALTNTGSGPLRIFVFEVRV
ncbi:MAG TPA: dimethylsulfonioproprionate lyase family protein [Candidatus Polarisedimenticolia bacterium]|nr:dimethylsulfonioproprionate lyase family protein [Candidatus Polarisedimenticolia bacterium]